MLFDFFLISCHSETKISKADILPWKSEYYADLNYSNPKISYVLNSHNLPDAVPSQDVPTFIQSSSAHAISPDKKEAINKELHNIWDGVT